MKTFLLCALAVHLAFVPCYADVMPTRRPAERNGAAERAVKDRLEQLGLNAAQARHELGELSASETAYFAADVNRLQPVGGLYWYEFLIGVGVLAGLVALYLWVTD
jgi:hypothetical protein